MPDLEHAGKDLANIHRKPNDKKYFCYFTGFLEGVAASGMIEDGEVSPLVQQCHEFALNISDPDALDFVQDFEAGLLEHGSVVDAIHYRAQTIDKACDKSSLNRFMGYCAGIACDDLIQLKEAIGIVEYAEQNPSILRDSSAAAIVFCCKDAVIDGMINEEESAEICEAITALVGDSYADTGISALGGVPVFSEGELPCTLHEMKGQVFVFTGNFEVTPRRIIEDQVTALNAKIAKSVTKKTDFVVVGAEAARDWVFTHKGLKLNKALKMHQDTGRPQFVSEAQLKKYLILHH
jgi:hypothetical protein